MHDVADLIARWALTYALHAGAFLALAWLVDRLPRVPDPVRESAWRLAILGALATATAQVTFAVQPWTGAWHAALVAPSAAPVGMAAIALPIGAGTDAAATGAAPWRALDVAVCAWMVVASVALVHLAGLYLRLRQQLLPVRRAVELEREVVRLAGELRLRRAPRLAVSPRAPTPLALGLVRPQICVPERALRELGGDELSAMLAHELAHVRRRDPAWTLLYAVVCRALFWHPATWVARKRLLALAETRCDALASASGPRRGLALARALLRAAEWLAPPPRGLATAHGRAMAASLSGLHRRVHLLLAAPPPPRGATVRVARLALGLAFAGSPLALPAVVETSRVVPAAGDPTAAAAMPAPLAALTRDVEALRAEVRELRALAAQAGLAADPTIGPLLREIDRRIANLTERCAALAGRYRANSSIPLPLR